MGSGRVGGRGQGLAQDGKAREGAALNLLQKQKAGGGGGSGQSGQSGQQGR